MAYFLSGAPSDGRNADRRFSKPLLSRHPQVTTRRNRRAVSPFPSCKSQAKKNAVSDRGTLGGLTQFSRLASLASVEPAESKRDLRKRTRGTGVCDNLFEPARNLLILKRRDAGAVDQARLESDSGEPHRVLSKHLFAQSIQRLPAAECLSM